MLTRRLPSILLFICLPFIITSKTLEFNQLSVENGLSNNFVRAIYKDSWGYLWIGSSEGIDRYDGWEIESFNKHLPDNISRITSIAEDTSHVLWVGTESGLFTWDRFSPSFENSTHPSLSQSNIKKIVATNEQIYICTDQGLYVNSGNKIEQLIFHQEIMDRISDVTDFIIENNQLYITLPGEIIQYDYASKSSIIISNAELLSAYPSALFDFTCVAKYKNRLYLGTYSEGVYSYNLKTKTISHLDELENNIILSIKNYGKKLLVGTDANGLKVKDLDSKNKLRSYRSENAVYSILKDNNNVLWLGTYTGGVYSTSLTDKAFQAIIYDNKELQAANIRSLYFTPSEKYIGTRNGLFIIDDKQRIRHLTPNNSALKSKVIVTIFPFNESVLIGTYGNGIYNYSNETHSTSPWMPELFGTESIYAFDKDKSDNLWITTLKGLYVVADSIPTLFNTNNSELKSNSIYALKVDHLNRIWIGTMQGVFIYKLERGKLKKISHSPESCNSKITDFYLEENGNMWVSTENKGFFVYDDKLNEKLHFTEENGLCHNSVSSIIQTGEDKYLISTLKGASLFNATDNTFLNYNLVDGLPGLTFNSGAVLKNDDNSIILGNVNGIVEYRPNVNNTSTEANIIITNIYVGGKELSDIQKQAIGKPIEEVEVFSIKGNNNIGFRVVNTASLSNTNVGYLVKLEHKNKQEEWEEIDNKGTVYYSNLPSGNHRFTVKLANDASNEEKSIIVQIKPKLSSKFYILGLVSLFVGLIFYLRVKNKQNTKVVVKDKYSNSHLSKDDSKSILEDIRKYIEKEKVFLQPELKIRDIATATEYPIRSISQAINQNLNMSFVDYINHFRVEEIKQRLNNPDNHHKFTLLAIAKNCGFNSKSSFYRAFKKETGQTPAEYWAHIKE